MTLTQRVTTALLAAVLGLATVPATAAVASPAVPASGPEWTSMMHGDPESSDSTAFPGPGRGAHLAGSSVPGGVCAATFVTGDGYPMSLCTAYVERTPRRGASGVAGVDVAVPVVTLFHPKTARVLAKLPLAKGDLFGGVYGFLDARDRVVVADGTGSIVRVGKHRTADGWRLRVDARTDISRHLRGDGVTGLAPDYQGRTWFATTHGVVGTVDAAGRVGATRLPRGERLGNGLTIRRGGASVLSTHALYEMRAGDDGVPHTVWRRSYDRGKARKPGQLTWGSGTTPTYFGPGGDAWVAIVDSAAVPELIVYRADDGSQVCRMKAFRAPRQGTENSPMAWGNSLVIPSTYGFVYPPIATSGGPSVPASAPFRGGMTRVDVTDGRCSRVWETRTDRMATLPRLSRADGMIHGLAYGPYRGGVQQSGPVNYVAIDFATGRRIVTERVGAAPVDEPLQLTGMIAPDGTLWQGTVTRMLKVAPGRRTGR